MSSWWRDLRADTDANGRYDAAALGGYMKRRTFIAGILSSAALPLAVHAQRSGKSPVIGYIGANTEATDRPRIDAFMRRLADLGWVENRSIVLDTRWTNMKIGPGSMAHSGEFRSVSAKSG